MSGVLDRTVMRARGVLPSVQPLVAPRFAQTSSVFGEVMNEVEVSPRMADPIETQWRAAPAKPPAHVREFPREVARRREEPPQALIPQAERREPQAERREQTSGEANAVRTEQRASSEKRPTGEAPKPREIEPIDRKEREFRVRETGAEPGPSRSPERNAEINEVKEQKDVAPKIRENRTSIQKIDRTWDIERRAANADEPSPKSMSRDAASRTKAIPDAPQEQSTEIHISIGSVELRAPRPEARAPVAPFRPRVTLSEFLRRKPGAGA